MSRLRFYCPGCDSQLTCPPGRAGQQVRCPRCGHSVGVPSLPLPPSSGRPALRLGLLGAGGGILLALVCSLLSLRQISSLDPPPEPVSLPQAEAPLLPSPPPPPPRKVPDNKAESKAPTKDPPQVDFARLALDKLNACRQSAGLPAVSLAEDLSRQCRLRAEALAREEPPHGASEEGQVTEVPVTGHWSLVARHRDDPVQAIENSMARLSSRLLLLQRGLKTIGLGSAQNKAGVWVTVLQSHGIGDFDPDPVCYPADNQRDVPLAFAGGREIPGGDNRRKTAGFPITLTFAPARTVKNVRARLEDEKGSNFNIWLSTPEQPAQPRGQRNSIALISWDALLPASTYRVQVSAEVDEKKWSRSWSFHTCRLREGDEALAKGLLAQVNEYRQGAGLGPVTLDPSLSKGCLAHARYLVRNLHHRATLGLGAHDEDLSLPGATLEGKNAGQAAVIAIEDPELRAGLEGLLATLYHRLSLLHPNLKRIGLGSAQSNRRRWTTVVDVQRGREAGSWKKPIFFPVDGQTEVPLAFPTSGEEPDPIPEDRDGQAGFPITVTFPPEAVPRKAVAALEEEGGTRVPVWFSSPDQPANPLYATRQGTTVCLIPKDPLRPGTSYRVSLAGEMNGKNWQASWRFTTRAARKVSEEVLGEVVAKINSYRQAARLKPVELDPLLAQGCAAHAQYLVRHADLRVTRKLLVNSEDPNLPGFTPEGQAASRQADFLFNAPSPLVQVDELLGTFFRRVYVLDPALGRVGFGCAHDAGRGWVCVLDLVSGRSEEGMVFYPADGQKDVPCVGQERPADNKEEAVGYLISATFPATLLVKEAALVLKDVSGNPVPASLSTRGSDPTGQGYAVYLIPHRPLQPSTTYQVSGSAQVSARPWRHCWQFTTKAP